MTKKTDINKMRIIIPSKQEDSPSNKRDEILKNLKEITPEQLTTINEEMKIAREKRENEFEKEMNEKHRRDISTFERETNSKKTKNLMRFMIQDSKATENWEKVWIVLLYDYTRNYENVFSDLEYWTKIFIKVWDYETSKELVYRDAYDPAKDDWSKAYTKISRIEIQGDTLKVWLSKKEWDATLYEIKIPNNHKKNEERNIGLNYNSPDIFKEYIKQEEERLIEKETRNQKYPNVFWYGARSIPNIWVSEIPYDKAIIADEHINNKTWVCYIVIKTQIDADASKGKKYSWIKYRIEVDRSQYNPYNGLSKNNDSQYITTLVEHFDAWEEDLVKWLKVKINAIDN